MASAICTPFKAAPLSSWSPATNMAIDLPEGSLDVLPDAADQDIPLPGGLLRHREIIFFGSSTILTPGAPFRSVADFLRRDGPVAFKIQRLGMSAQDRHAHAGGRHADVGVRENFARLVQPS